MEQNLNNIFPDLNNIPEKYKLKSELIQREYLINGEIRIWNGEQQAIYSPVCKIVDGKAERIFIGSYPLLTEKESLEAMEAAKNAYNNGQGLWATMKVEERIECLENFTKLMIEKRDEVVNLLMWEIGKTLADSQKEFDRTVIYIKDTIEATKELDRQSSKLVIEEDIMGQIKRSPLGVVLCMGPFNYPLNETFTTLIPALIMGNTIIFKPPKLGVLLHYPLLQAFQKAFPAGVVNTVYGDGRVVITPLMTSGKLDVLAFIGSSRVADILKHQHPKPHRLRSVLGLEAKNAAIVLDDADLDLAVNECLLGSLSYNGQRCTALKILFVHKNIVEQFNKKYIELLNKLKIGMPWEEGVKLTPLPEDNKSKYMTDYIEDAQKNGANVINPNGGIYNNTFFYPAVLFPVNDKMKIFYEEQFGPIVPIVEFEDMTEPENYIINSNYGQQVSIFSTNSDKIAELIDKFVNQVCRVNINSQCQRGPDMFPFTGRKDSAEGTLSVSDALRVFSIRSLVAAKINVANKKIVKEIINQNKSNFLSNDFVI